MSETADHRDGRDRIPGEIACLPIDRLPASMISDVGNHCQVWRQGGGFVQGGKRTSSDLVIKKFRDHCSFAEARVYAREHRRLCEALDDMIPATLYVHTRVDGQDSVIAIAETVPTWFNVANPHNEGYLRTKRDRMGHTLHHQGLALDDEMIHDEQERDAEEGPDERGAGAA